MWISFQQSDLSQYATMFFMAKKVLVTGAGGYIGSINSYKLLEEGYDLVALDNFSTGFEEPLELLQNKYGLDRLKIYKLNLADNLMAIFRENSMENPIKYFSNNVAGTINLLQTMLQANVTNLVFSSTCATFGETEVEEINESHIQNPANPYGESKMIIEQMIRWLGKQSNLHYVVLRYFNVCGATDDGLIGDAKKPSVHLMQNAVKGALGLEEFALTYSPVATPDGSPIRDYVNVVDLADAHIRALEYLFNGGASQMINIGTGSGNSVLEVVRKVEEITGHKFALKKGEPRQGEYAKAIASIKKAQQVLGWSPTRSIEDSVRSLVKWYKARPQGWER